MGRLNIFQYYKEYQYFLIIFLMLGTAAAFSQDNIVFFSDSPDGDELYDSSWGFETSPSDLELAGSGGEKFPVDAQHPYKGAHSLRLHWTSSSGGDWGVAVASIGWADHDFTQYDSVIYWINGLAAIAKADLPDLSLEDVSNKKSTKVFLGDYLEGVDSDSLTWQKVSIPVNAFEPGPDNCDFTKIKTIFHWQKNADGVEHIAWLDEIKVIKAGSGPGGPPVKPAGITAKGADSRIDLKWKRNTENDLLGYYIYRSESFTGAYTKLNPVAHEVHLYCDYFGENDRTYYYYVKAVNEYHEESVSSDTVSAASYAMSEEELLTSVQEAAFRYFYDYGHPVSGLARERKGSDETCTSGGTGMGLITLVVGAERNFEPRDSISARVLKILSFMQDVTPRYHGVWSHWINGSTGETIPFSQYDNGGDIVETAFVAEGLLVVRQYFNSANSVEVEIRNRAAQLWESIEWDWYRRTSDTNGKNIYWHWSPNYGWQMNMPIYGFNEAMIVYLLAIASPTHPVPASLYYDGWCGGSNYVNGNEYYGYTQWVGWPHGGPLFFTHYSYL